MHSSDPRRRKAILLLGLVLVAATVISVVVWKLRYHLSYQSDLRDRPWAYSDSGAKLLVGTWHGKFTDPDGVEKELNFEVFLPLTDEQREEKLKRRVRHRKGVRPQGSKQSFEGLARVNGPRGNEEYHVSGSVGKTDFHQLEAVRFSPEDEARRILPNYAVREARPGKWRDDELTLTVYFSKLNADGSSTSTSEGEVIDGEVVWKDSPEDRPVTVTLRRREP